MSSDLLSIASNIGNWALIPSDPAIFNDMLKEYNTKDIKVQEVYSLDFDYLKSENPIYGMIFASECKEEILAEDYDQVDPDAEKIVYASQIITNICGTLALLAILFNADVSRGNLLNNFLEFTSGFSSIDRGMALGNCPEIYKIHHAYSTSQHQSDSRMTDLDDDALVDTNQELTETTNYHYVSYIYKEGHVWELDGLKNRPIKLAACSEEDWLDALKPVIEKRMKASNDEEIAFNLMVVTPDSLSRKKEEATTYSDCLKRLDDTKNFENTLFESQMQDFFDTHPNSNLAGYCIMQELWKAHAQQENNMITEKTAELTELKTSLDKEIQTAEIDVKMTMNDVTRQKFDYFPFLEKLFQLSHKSGVLQSSKEYTAAESTIAKNANKKLNLSKKASAKKPLIGKQAGVDRVTDGKVKKKETRGRKPKNYKKTA